MKLNLSCILNLDMLIIVLRITAILAMLQQCQQFSFSVLQTQVIAAAAAGVAAGGLTPKAAKIEAENAAQLSVALVENAIVILMLVEDHLRLQSKLYSASSTSPSPLSSVFLQGGRSRGDTSDPTASRNSSTSDSGRPSLNVHMY